MKVVLFHPTLLPPKDYGGVERVVLWLAQGLKEHGHQVWVGALAGSKLPSGVQLIEVNSQDRSATSFLKQLPSGVDVVHFMAPPENEVWGQLPCAGLLTVHGNGKPGEVFPKNTVFLSRDHAERHGATEFVYNGIDPSEILFRPNEKEDRFLFLSKTSWRVKNLQGAVSFCKRAGVGLRVAGGNRPVISRIRVGLMKNSSWEGPVSGIRKAELLTRAKAFLFPVTWPEPFGLVVIEALMSGTPVIATPQGSLKELVPADVGQLISLDRPQEWIECLRNFGSGFDPERCRKWAIEKFHYRVMTENYLKVYSRVGAGGM